MVGSVVLCCALIVGAENSAATPENNMEAYRQAAATVGRDADAQVKLALWCEANGLTTERLKHLTRAVLADPQHAGARALLGHVRDGDAWLTPEQVAERTRADAEQAAALAEYNERRAKAGKDADAQWALALWCEGKGLKAEATAHLTAVTLLDPGREAAWKRLGYSKKQDGRWRTAAEIAADKAEADAQRRADKAWRPKLEAWKAALKEPKKQAGAEAELAALTDPRAVPSVWRVFAAGDEADATRAVQLLGQIDTPLASRALAALAVMSPSAEVRRRSAETLRWRDPREFAGALVELVRSPLKYEVKAVGGPGAPGVLFVEGERYNVRRVYGVPQLPALPRLFDDSVAFDPFTGSSYALDPDRLQAIAAGVEVTRFRRRMADVSPFEPTAFDPRLNVLLANGMTRSNDPYIQAVRRDMLIGANLLEAQRSTGAAQQQFARDVAEVEAENQRINEVNARLLPILIALAGQDLGGDRAAWQRWWLDQQGLGTKASPKAKPTFTQFVSASASYMQACECFAAGTPVLTLAGPRPIDRVEVGDRVLSQDTATGALGYRPVLAVRHNPPSKTLKLTLDGESLVTTPFHRFWRPGQGWAMARELRPGDAVRTRDGLARVAAVADDRTQPMFNLDVAEDRTFFVGQTGVLVHDNSLPGPRSVPFDAPAVARRGR